jgi:hypothetical protein
MTAVVAHVCSPSAPLNVFQRLLLQWDGLHPYNAGQILKIAGPPDVSRLSRAWEETLSELGLGLVRRSGRQFHHETLNGEMQRYPVRVLPAGTDLCSFVSEELNRPFDDEAEPPFRPFVLDERGHHYAGVVYHHWVADSVSIRVLLREWFYRVFAPERARRTPLKHASDGYWSIFGPSRANWGIGGGVLSSARWSARNRRVARVEHPGYTDFSVRFSLHQLPGGILDPLLSFARRNGATLNDLFLAVVAEVCHRLAPVRQTERRTDLALGTIVDLRPYSKQDLSDTFGLFLGFTSTICRPADLADFGRLLRTISTQSDLHKKTAVPLSSPLRMLAGLAVGKLFSRRRMVEFYRKRIPLAGGISNVNLNRSWAAEFCPSPLLDYVRVSPTGPLMPLVFTPTTLGKEMHLGLTHRPALIDHPRADEMARQFGERLKAIAGMA